MVSTNFVTLSQEEAVRKIMAGEPLKGCFIENLDLSNQEIPGIATEDCQIGNLNLSSTTVLGKVCFNHTVFLGQMTLGWKSVFHKTGSAIFQEPVTFQKCVFQGELRAGGVEFRGMVSFQNGIFQKEVTFRDAVFEEQAFFGSAQFAQLANFTSCKFGIEAHFNQAEFIREALFDNVQFKQKEASFNGIHAHERISFLEARFEGYASFTKALIVGEADFKKSHFEQEANFVDAQFKDKVSFRGASFKNKVTFLHTLFYGLASFLGTSFHEVNFLNSQFHNEALFNHDRNTRASLKEGGTAAQFYDNSDFTNVRFHKRCVFEEVSFEKSATFANCYFGEQVTFMGTHFHAPVSFNNVYCNQELSAIDASFKEVTFDYANINRRLDLSDASLNSISFYKAALDLIVVSKSQIRKRLLNEKPNNPQYTRAKEEYLILKESFQQRGLFEEEDWAYRKFRQTKRKASTQKAWSVITGKQKGGFFSGLAKLIGNGVERILVDRGAGYGTQPLNISIVAIATILLFASVYAYFPSELVYDHRQCPQFDFSHAIYFSFTVFTTMGLGDIQPRLDSLMRYVISVEAFLGIFIMTLFVGTYIRKIIR